MPVSTFQPAAAVGQDAYLTNLNPATNYGNDVEIAVGEHGAAVATLRSWLHFTELDGGEIPSSAKINSTILHLFVSSDNSLNARTLRVYRCKRVVVEAQVTWNIYSTGNNWSTAGASHADDREGTDIGNELIAATPGIGFEYQITLTAAKIQEMVKGTFTNNGFILQVDTENDDLIGYDSSDSVTAGERPKLVVDWTPPPKGVIWL